jgi:hypothetical protein
MPVIDPSTDIGKLRLSVGDYRDLPFLPDAVYQQVLDDNGGSVKKAVPICANYILGMLVTSTRSKLAQIESYDNQEFEQYKQFLQMTIKDPNFMPYSPIVSGGKASETANALIQAGYAFKKNYANTTITEDANDWAGTYNGLPVGNTP